MAMPASSEKWIDINGVKTRYFEKGRGPTVMLVFGGNFGAPDAASSAAVWDTNFEWLAARFHVIAIDKLGQGHTDNPLRDEDYRIHAAVDHGYAFLERLGLRNVHLVGHSRGGYYVTRLTLEHPEVVASCTCIDSNTTAPGRGLNEIVLANPPGEPLSRECQKWTYEKYAYSYHHITEDLLDANMKVAALPKTRAAIDKMQKQGLQKSLFLPDLQKGRMQVFASLRDKGMPRPTNIIWGYNDPTAPFEQGVALYELTMQRTPIAQFNVVNEAGHHVFREQPAIFNEIVRGWIAGLA